MKQQRPFTVVYEDTRLLAVDKAPGIPVTPERWDTVRTKTLARLAENALGHWLWIVHRIDKETSGLVLFAKSPKYQTVLSEAFAKRLVKKCYIAIINGRPAWEETVCELPLVPDGNKRHQTIVDRGRGKSSTTAFKLLCAGSLYSIVEARPETGRTHQIRVHLAALGHPIACDPLYGDGKSVFLSGFKRNWRGDKEHERPLLARLGLHAASLEWDDLRLEAPLPKDMKALSAQLKQNAK
jgi:23S rRNA pseudouridine1911/1915/1917 synthase